MTDLTPISDSTDQRTSAEKHLTFITHGKVVKTRTIPYINATQLVGRKPLNTWLNKSSTQSKMKTLDKIIIKDSKYSDCVVYGPSFTLTGDLNHHGVYVHVELLDSLLKTVSNCDRQMAKMRLEEFDRHIHEPKII